MIIAFLIFFLLPSISISQQLPGLFIDCGSSVVTTYNDLNWVSDDAYISAGTSRNLSIENAAALIPILYTVRTFPLQGNLFRKFCYEINVDRNWRNTKYLIRTTYYYGEVNGNVNPPVFDQIVDGTLWSVVNTTGDYLSGNMSYYEGVFMPTGKNLSVCLAANTYTDSDPFISALEVVPLLDQVYNSTDFTRFGLGLVARHSFGYAGPMIRYPTDRFNRYWLPFGESTSASLISENLVASGIWNLPPRQVFETNLASSNSVPLPLLWPPGPLPSANYCISLYFADDQTSISGGSRTLDITINGVTYYNNLSVMPAGVSVFANEWPLSGITNLTLTATPGSSRGPLINGGEVFQVIPSGGRTRPRDVMAMIDLREGFRNPPPDWNGDPCLPPQYPWSGVTCSYEARIRVVTLNLTSLGIYGSISPNISMLTALSTILLGNNSLSGTIPDLTPLRGLEVLHLEDNQLGGIIPASLGDITNLRELFLQNNNLTGQVPNNLLGRPGLNLRYTPGNPSLTTPTS